MDDGAAAGERVTSRKTTGCSVLAGLRASANQRFRLETETLLRFANSRRVSPLLSNRSATRRRSLGPR
jgi:hypothetical protein